MIGSSIITKPIRHVRCHSLLASAWNSGHRQLEPERICRQNNNSQTNPIARNHSSNGNSSSIDHDSNDFQIPKPTWSIRDLDLTAKRPPLPEEELDRLSKLALIDFKAMGPKDQESLGQDLANMLHMIDQVTQYDDDEDNDNDNSDSGNDDENIQAAAQIYDLVRGGLTKAPLRKSLEQDHLQDKDEEIAKDVWEKMLQPKTKRMGGRHEYFAIQTKTEETSD
ncbi:unnamed protein product [Cylindrotheca closterium]|uniref:Uncharacterized protein n=2 Tax=Cylindrotheca closterium TaxID=2856 RepID=A0AAD2JM26_9STRA|nr:unnamed protein product [Cylindrotheca closterium]